jgi:DNA-binding response OmpR family regulator
VARILVVEDEQIMRDLLRMHLSSAGYAVEAAEDAISAGYKVLKSTPDLIICDVEMPHMSGIEFITALRAEHALARVPVIFLTSLEAGEVRPEALRAEYLQKPVRLEELLSAVRRQLAAARPPLPS